MRLLNVNGKLVFKNVSRFLIKWDKPSKSIIQYKAKQFLKPYWNGQIVYEEFPVYGSLLKVDIVNATLRIAIEVHGPQHSEYHWFHGGKPSEYLHSIQRDIKKMDWLAANNFTIAEIYHTEIDLLSKKFFLEKFGISL